jgi:hypothetical protein
VALSIAVIAAIAAPLASGSWRLENRNWIAVPQDEEAYMKHMIAYTKDCTEFEYDAEDENHLLAKVACRAAQEELARGGHWQSEQHFTWGFLFKNIWIAVRAFIVTFAVFAFCATYAPRYWRWLRH